MNTKTDLFEFFDGLLSKSSIKQTDDGEWLARGKFGEISVMDDCIDVWLTSVHTGKELGQRKVNAILTRLPPNLEVDIDDCYVGEASFILPLDVGKDDLMTIAILLGMRKKKVMSPESIAAARERMKALHAARQECPV
jgi:hypothetical protein